MTYSAGTQGANANCASALAATLGTVLTTAGFVFVETYAVSTNRADIYKSPGASNAQGADWYLGVYRTADTATVLFLQVGEVWDTGTKKFRNYAPLSAGLVPAATTWAVNDAVGVLPGGSIFLSSVGVSVAGFQYWVSASVNRVVLATRVSTVDYGVYAGLYDDLLPATASPFPLCVLTLSNLQSTSSAGAATREPLQAAAATANFKVSLNTAIMWGCSTAQTDIYRSALVACRVPLVSVRAAGAGFNPVNSTAASLANPQYINQAYGLRGLLKDVVFVNVGTNGDTLTATDMAGGVKTYTHMADQTATVAGLFMHTWADQAV